MLRDIIIPNRLGTAIRRAAFNSGQEAGAWLLFRRAVIGEEPWTKKPRERLILSDVLPFEGEDIASASPTHLTVRTSSFVRTLKYANDNGYTVGFLHGHPCGTATFSVRDDENELALFKAARNRNGPGACLVSVLAISGGRLLARIWQRSTDPDPSRLLETGQRIALWSDHTDNTSPDLDRQARVFGETFNVTLRNLSCLVVGAGGTGSPLAVMLARSGLGRIAIIDHDVVESTNLHRLYGATQRDIGRHKAEVLAAHINEFGLPTQAMPLVRNLLDPECRDALKSADVIFCATDDHASRMLLNRFSVFYEIPVFDIGLAVAGDQGNRRRDMTGRVTCLHSGAPCLLCRGIIDPVRAREDELRKRAPDQYADQQREGYILGGGEPEPAFIGMTTSVACLAMDEFAQAVSEFRGPDGHALQRLRRFHIPEDRRTGGRSDNDCPICGQTGYWGRGDVVPFLDRIG